MVDSSNQIPRIYLDQNVLSLIVNGKLEALKKGFQSGEYQLIYSRETINEIARCGQSDFHSQALNALSEMNGLYLQVKDDESATLLNASVHQLFDEERNQPVTSNQVWDAMQQFIFKLHGGRQGEDFTPVLEEQKHAFTGLMNHLKDQLSQLSEEESAEMEAIASFVYLIPDMTNQNFQSKIDEMASTFNQSVPNPESIDGPNAWQDHFGVGAEQLNNIEPPKVIEKIWEQLSASGKLPEQMQSMDNFMAPFYGMPHDKNEPSWANKIRGLYLLLNFVGYWPDKKRRKWDKFVGSQSDMNHAVFGAYSNILISEDDRFVKKTAAIYEYLGLNTKVLHLVNGGDGK